jgi:glutaconyl-CoA/methylmalonyl-CoA decarboxylase subunit gamma
MIYKVKIDGRVFEVRIEDLNSRPIVAIVDGEAIDVWPQTETGASIPGTKGDVAHKPAPVSHSNPQDQPIDLKKPGTTTTPDSQSEVVYSPLPGVVVSVAVQPNESVEAGQELLVLEAMKMKNTIRAGRSATVKAVHVVPGQAVQHHDLLLEYAD